MENTIATYIKVHTVNEAVAQMQLHTKAMVVAGGTDVFVNKQQGNTEAELFIDISEIKSLQTVSIHGNKIEIGALVTLEKIITDKELARFFPALKEAALAVATPVIRKTATVGGNILCENRCSFYNQSEWWREAVGYCLKCNGDICIATGGKKNCFSKFVSDTAPVFIALRANAVIADENGEKTIPLENLYTGDGVNPVAISRQTLLKSIEIPITKTRVIFKKLRPRKSLDFTSLTTAVSLDEEHNLRIVIGGVDPRPVVAEGNIKKDDMQLLVTGACKKPRVVENDYYSRNYRKEMINVFINQSIKELGI
ncbi:MAG: FAD binding domain-containing protein [Bacteroidia bacterium]|nr:FAD binding domain-containing protein [Bacteroidia bacterium]